MSDSKRILLVHGAWGRADSWRGVARMLRQRGHDVSAFDLPGHGDDPARPEKIGMADYAARIVEELEKGPPALLVGHSMGGMAISAAAELAPEHIRKLVYLCAFLPRDGDSLLSLIKRQGKGGIQDAVRPGPALGTTVLDPDMAVDYLCQDANDGAKAQVKEGLCVQSNAAQTDPVHLTDRFDALPRAYIICENDRTITPALQRAMLQDSPCDPVLSLQTGHLPQITAPAALADMLDAL